MISTSFGLKGAVVAVLLAGGGAAHAATVSVSRQQNFTVTGQDFDFTFGGLEASDGTGGSVVIEAGGIRNPGVDVSDPGEYFDVTLDGTDFGRFSCAGSQMAAEVDTVISLDLFDCVFSHTIALEGAQLDAMLSDGTLLTMLDFNIGVGKFENDDFVRVTLNYGTATAIPLPASGLLLLGAVASFGLWRGRAV